MKRFKRILFVARDIPGIEGLLETAVALAERNQARLTVAGMLGERPPKLEILTRIEVDDFWDLVAREKTQELEALVAPFLGRNVEIRTELLAGIPFLEITREALRNECDLVVMPADGDGENSGTLFGSLSMHLMRKCPCPVWLLKPTRRHSWSRVLAAVDPAVDSSYPDTLSQTIVELAISLAETQKAELHVVHAWTVFAERIFRKGARSSLAEVTALMREVEHDHRARVQMILRDGNRKPVKCHLHIEKGDAGIVIPQIARTLRADVVVMGTVARTGVAGFLMGSTAETILRQLHCSVLAVTPSGFVTPVQLAGD